MLVGWAERSEPQHLYSVTPEEHHALEEMLGRASLGPTLYRVVCSDSKDRFDLSDCYNGDWEDITAYYYSTPVTLTTEKGKDGSTILYIDKICSKYMPILIVFSDYHAACSR